MHDHNVMISTGSTGTRGGGCGSTPPPLGAGEKDNWFMRGGHTVGKVEQDPAHFECLLPKLNGPFALLGIE